MHAHRAIAGGDDAALREVAELAAAFAPSKERHLETTAQGRAFLEATRAAWPCAALDRLLAAGTGRSPIRSRSASPARDTASARAGAARLPAGVGRELVSAGVRLVPLGQTDGQRVLAALEPVVAATAERALVDAARRGRRRAFRADLASMRHETQYTRLFRS